MLWQGNGLFYGICHSCQNPLQWLKDADGDETSYLCQKGVICRLSRYRARKFSLAFSLASLEDSYWSRLLSSPCSLSTRIYLLGIPTVLGECWIQYACEGQETWLLTSLRTTGQHISCRSRSKACCCSHSSGRCIHHNVCSRRQSNRYYSRSS